MKSKEYPTFMTLRHLLSITQFRKWWPLVWGTWGTLLTIFRQGVPQFLPISVGGL